MSWDQLAKTPQHGWKERLKISKVAKIESDLLKNYEDIAQQSRGILQTFCMVGARSRLHHTSVKCRAFLEQYLRLF